MADRVGQQLGHYRLLRVLGQGAFAEVYLAEHQYLERPAAIKVLQVQMDPERQEHFRREARTIGHLHHPHIVQILDFGIHDQTPYLVMEYTPGGTLRSHHPKGRRLPLEQIVTYVKQIASALDYAHQQRVIHRDVKPDNLLLNAKDEVVLSDFGIAVVQRTLDSLSMHKPAGTPLYMAPEQIQHHPCVASDQYALGIMVYEWLVGEAPFRGTLFEVFSHHLYQPPPSLHEQLPDLPIAMEEAVFRALAKDPAQRFASVADFASALEEACGATQPLTLHGVPFVPAPVAKEQEGSSFSTQPRLRTTQQRERGQEGMPSTVPGLVLHSQPLSKQVKPSLAQSNRQRFLRRVRAFWIDGVLEHSLHGDALIALGLQEQPDAVANPWQLVLHPLAGAPHPLPAGTRITQVYDAAEGELLILGAPGSGKTTLLLELARELLARAEHDEQHPLPVVFNLSSWASKQQPLADWLVEELNRTYQVPHPLGQAWVETDQILPLLDGLDEVALKDRTQCIETINTYREVHGLLPLVVCSRSADYLAQSVRVRLGSAVMVQPLTQQQVDDYLVSGGEPLWALRMALHQDAALRELTSSPLMLSILTLTYHDIPVEDLLRGGIAPTGQEVFEHYVERMLTRRGVSKRFSHEQTLRWLTFLAARMQQHHQTVFYLERLRPEWLAERRRRLLYRLSVGLNIGLVFGVSVGLSVGLYTGLPLVQLGLSAEAGLTIGLQVGLLTGLTSGLLTGLIATLVYGLGQIQPREVLTLSWRWTKGNIVVGLLVGLSIGLVLGVSAGLGSGFGGGSDGLVNGLQVGLLFGLVATLVPGLPIGLVAGLVAGFSTNQLDDRLRFTPNQGIWRSASNGLRVGFLNGLLVALLVALSVSLSAGLLNGLLVALLIGLVFGLGAFFQHFTLRFWLWRAGYLPWNLAALLDEASTLLLLRKVGGGYMFVHRLLLEYFASLDTTPKPDAARAKKEQAEPAS